MPKEKEAYRDNLEWLDKRFKDILNVKEVSLFAGMDYLTIAKMFPFKSHYISKATLARYLS